MPTLFARRYLRGKPSRTEKVVGGGVLVIAGLIVGAFLLTGGLFAGLVNATPGLRQMKNAIGISEKPLFLADAENVKPPAPPHEMRVAEAMLPRPPAPWERREVKVIAVDDASGAALGDRASRLVSDAKRFGGRWLYHGAYGAAKAPLAEVYVADMGEPSNAFGLFGARRPTGGATLGLGRGGWQGKPDEGPTVRGFWSGRYYTEVVTVLPDDSADVEALAKSAAAVQLAYGGPFWAQDVLPPDDRVPDSFRYVRQEPLGLRELADLWLADYESGVTLGVARPEASRRDQMLAAMRERFAPAVGEAATHGDESGSEPEPEPPSQGFPSDAETRREVARVAEGSGPEGVVGWRGEWLVTAFPAGDYLFVAIGGDSGAVATLAGATYQRWSREAVGGADRAMVSREASPPPVQGAFAEVAGGDVLPPSEIERYRDNVYEKINGKEGAFRAFHFVELRFGRYADPRGQKAYDVYLFDMGEPVNAFGMYMSERSKTADGLKLGRDGYGSGASVYFWKNEYYVNVLGPADGGEAEAATALKIARAIEATITAEDHPFWAESLMPTEHRVDHSFAYVATSALTFDFLERVFIADYEQGERTYRIFLHRTKSPAEAAKLFARYVETTSKFDEIVSRDKDADGETVLSDSMGFVTVAFTKGVFFGGVAECEDQALATERAKAFRAKLPTSVPDAEAEAAASSATSERRVAAQGTSRDKHGY